MSSGGVRFYSILQNPKLFRTFHDCVHICFLFHQPVLVSQVDKYLNLDIWTPKSFGEEFGKFFLNNDTEIKLLED